MTTSSSSALVIDAPQDPKQYAYGSKVMLEVQVGTKSKRLDRYVCDVLEVVDDERDPILVVSLRPAFGTSTIHLSDVVRAYNLAIGSYANGFWEQEAER